MRKNVRLILIMFIYLMINFQIGSAETLPKVSLPTPRAVTLSQVPKGFKFIPSSLKMSPDLQHVTYVAYSDTTHNIVCLDNKTSPVYNAVQPPTPIFSSAKNRHAYIAYKTKTDAIVVVDGQPGEIIDRADNLQFSLDGSRYAYRAQKGKSYFVVVDGVPGPNYEGIPIKNNMKFSGDSKHFAYVDFQNKSCTFVLDGKEESKPFGFIIDVTFSWNSNHYAYKALTEKKGNKEKWCVVRDGRPETVYDKIFDLVFSFDSNHLVYAAIKDKKMVLVLDGNEIESHDIIGIPIFSADSQTLHAYAFQDHQNWYMVINQKKSSAYDVIGKFYTSLDLSRFAYFAKNNDKWVCVVDGKRGKEFETGGDAFIYSNDSKRYAYAGIEKNGARMITDETLSPNYASVGEPYFSPDSKHVVYRARKEENGNWFTVLDGKESSESYGAIGKYAFSPHSKHLAFPAFVNINKTVMVVDGHEQCKENNFRILDDPYFSPDDNHIAYIAFGGENNWHLVVNGEVLPESYGGFIKGTPLIFDAPNQFHTIGLDNTKTGGEFLFIECNIPESFNLKSSLQ